MITPANGNDRRSPTMHADLLEFPVQLHCLITEMTEEVPQDAERHSSLKQAMAWKPHGRSFAVEDPQKLEQDVLPKWFPQSDGSLEWFREQLELFGFRKVANGRDKGAFYHFYFIRGRGMRYLTHWIQPTSRTSNYGAVADPDFYSTGVLEVNFVCPTRSLPLRSMAMSIVPSL